MQGSVPGMLVPEPGNEGMESLGQPLLELTEHIESRFAALRVLQPIGPASAASCVQVLFRCP